MMQFSIKKFIITFTILSMHSLLTCSGLAPQEFSISKNFFQPRPASANIAREMMMQPNNIHKNTDGWYGNISATIFFQHGWNENNVDTINESKHGAVSALGAFSWWSGNNIMTVGTNTQASTTSATTLANLDAYQFGLGNLTLTSTAATIKLNPIIYQTGTDFLFIFGCDSNEPGFFAKIKAPLTAYIINPQFSESNSLAAVAYPAGALALGTSTITDPALTMTQAFTGIQGDATEQGDYTPIQFGLINGIQSTGARFADIEMTAGYTFINDDRNSFSIALRASAPTGNKATGIYLLEPIVGRGGNWGAGAYVAGQSKLWENNNDDSLSFKFMGDVMHLFTTNTMRSYDLLVNGPGSKYLLVANYQNNVYQGSIQNLINYTTLESQSTFGVEADIAVAFNYARNGLTIDAGYEFYGRSLEDLNIIGNFNEQAYAILGRQGIGFAEDPGTNSYACQPGATINSSVASLTGTTVPDITIVATGNTIGNALNPSNRISLTDLDIEAAEQNSYLTSKIFTKIGYEWTCDNYIPFCGIMAEFEFSNSFNNALPQWAIVAVGGITF